MLKKKKKRTGEFCSPTYISCFWGFQMLTEDDSTTFETQMDSKHFNTSTKLENLKKGAEA